MATCRNCQAIVAVDARFCQGCGVAQPDRCVSGEQAERRHLAVLFCDLVGSTVLARRLDAEDYADLLATVQERFARIIDAHAGYLARAFGDGMLAYFGYPAAREHPVEDAVRAGLEIARTAGEIDAGDDGPLAVRVGVADGPVVVGEIAYHDGRANVVGETPNLAARLQTLAPRNGVVVPESTRRRVGHRFDFVDLGPQSLKGFADPMRVALARAERTAQSDLFTRHPRPFTRQVGGVLAFVGRERELGQLEHYHQQAHRSGGRMVGVVGEAGIGKSRLVAEFCAGLTDARVIWMTASERHRNSPLYPVLRGVEHAAGIAPGDGYGARTRKLRRLLTRLLPPRRAREAEALLVDVLELPGANDPGLAELAPSGRRRRLLQLLVEMLGHAGGGQFVLVVEDAHDLDPTTREFLQRVARRLPAWRALGILTSRQSDTPITGDAVITVPPLQGDDASRSIAPHAPSRHIADQIVRKCQGVPLFLEEFTRVLLDQAPAGSPPTPPPVDELPLPDTLQDVLLARLEAETEAKQVAQVASVIGQTFRLDLVAEVGDVPIRQVERGVRALNQAGLLIRLQDGGWEFRHALLRDAAYGLLLRRARQTLHHRVAEALRRRQGGVHGEAPETLAHHLFHGGLPFDAADCWRLAGERALAQAAYAEAAHHLQQGLTALDAAEGGRHSGLELTLQSLLGTALMQLDGFATAEVEATHARAEALCRKLAGIPLEQRFRAIWGIWAVRITQGAMPEARDLAGQLMAIAGQPHAPLDLQVLTQAAQVPSAYYTGDFATALSHVDRVEALYDIERHRSLAITYTVDPRLLAFMFGALAAVGAGDTERAAALDEALNAHVDALGLRFQRPYALCMQAMQRVIAGRPRAAHALANEAVEIAVELDLGFWQIVGRIWRGAALVVAGDTEDGLATLESGLADYERIGARAAAPYLYAVLAWAYADSERFADAADAAERAETAVDARGELCHAREVRDLTGKVHARIGRAGRDASGGHPGP